jgi:hypothetical protein
MTLSAVALHIMEDGASIQLTELVTECLCQN